MAQLPVVSVLLATTGRPDAAERCARSLYETTLDLGVIELVASVDADPATLRRLNRFGRETGFPVLVSYREEYRGCSRAWNDALALAQGEQLVLAADDLIFEAGWLQAAQARMAEFEDGWGFVGFNDGHLDGELSTHYMVSRRLILEEFGGVIAWECYEHSFNDVEANERAKRAGRYAWCAEAHVRHQHWIFGDRAQDETDTRNLGGHPASQERFAARARAGFPNDYPPVIRT